MEGLKQLLKISKCGKMHTKKQTFYATHVLFLMQYKSNVIKFYKRKSSLCVFMQTNFMLLGRNVGLNKGISLSFEIR